MSRLRAVVQKSDYFLWYFRLSVTEWEEDNAERQETAARSRKQEAARVQGTGFRVQGVGAAQGREKEKQQEYG
jgi:hypothetical protein